MTEINEDDEVIIVDEYEGYCDYEGGIVITITYDYSEEDYDYPTPYRLRVTLFGDFEREDWFNSKERLISELEDLDRRFNSGLMNHWILEQIEQFDPTAFDEEER